MPKPDDGVRVLAHNRRAHHDYHVLETLEAGLQLAGTEVKSARDGKVQLKDSFVELRDGEAWLVRAHIGPPLHPRQSARTTSPNGRASCSSSGARSRASPAGCK